jgi:protease-4
LVTEDKVLKKSLVYASVAMQWKSLASLWAVAFLALMVFGCITVKVSLFEEPEPLKEKVVSGYARDKILLMDVSGLIMEGPRKPWFSLAGFIDPGRVKEELEKAAKDRRIKAIVLRINSPGGTVSASDMIHHEIAAFKKEHNLPVVACLMGLAASGGYYVAQAADVIVAHPTGVTGSIGVVAMKLNVKGLMEKVGVESDLVKSGQWKDFWSPFRPASPEEKQMMQCIIDDFYRRFITVVAQGRNLAQPEAKRLADGRIYTAEQARDVGLVDRLGYLDDAIDLAKARAGITEARVVLYHRPGSYRPTVYSLTPELLPLGPQFLYLWWPGEIH